MDPRPSLRAEVVKHMIRQIDETRSTAPVALRIPADLRRQVSQASRYEWVEFAVLEPVYTLLWRELGRREYIDFFADLTRRAAAGDMLVPFIAKLERTFAGSPWGMFKNLPRSFELTTRNTGSKRAERLGRRKAVFIVEALPRPLRRAWYAFSLVPCVEFAASLAEHEGTVSIDDNGLGAGRLALTLRWSPSQGESRSPEDSYVDGSIEDSVTDGVIGEDPR